MPGESFLAALDGLHDSNRIKTIICRQEGGAAMMAEAWGKVTGEPGVCFVTRGPGLANAMGGLHVAQQDSTPMVLFVGLPHSQFEDREAFQEIDTKGLLGSFVKWAAVIRQTERIPEYVSHAYHVARAGRPGPVVLGLPEDMLAADCAAADARGAQIADCRPSAEDLAELQRRLAKASRPVLIVGGPGWSTAAKTALEAFADRLHLPVACAFRYQDHIDNRHRCYVGCAGIGIEPTLGKAIKTADLLIVVGARLGEITTAGYDLLQVPNPAQQLVHVHPSADELGSVYRADLPIVSSTHRFAEALGRLEPAVGVAWSSHTEALRAAYAQLPQTGPACRDRSNWPRSYAQPPRSCLRMPSSPTVAGNYRRLPAPPFRIQGLPHPVGTHLRLDGLRLAGGDRGKDRAPRTRRCQFSG